MCGRAGSAWPGGELVCAFESATWLTCLWTDVDDGAIMSDPLDSAFG